MGGAAPSGDESIDGAIRAVARFNRSVERQPHQHIPTSARFTTLAKRPMADLSRHKFIEGER
jgi:hypothetical protein